MTREAAYRIVQRNARISTEQRRQFRDVLLEDPEVSGAFADKDDVSGRLDEAFDLSRSFVHIRRTFDALEQVAG
jgi:adenylosuccinate lyase